MRDSPLNFAIQGGHLRWMDRGYCNGIPRWSQTFFADEVSYRRGLPAEAPPDAQRLCGACVVRVECLAYALAHDEYGVWGGTTRQQREAMSRPIVRAKCPACQGKTLFRAERQQICADCGASWEATKIHGNARQPVHVPTPPAAASRLPKPVYEQPPLFDTFALAAVTPKRRTLRRRPRRRTAQLALPLLAA